MATVLPRGTELRVAGTDVKCVIDRMIGEGGQGAVYVAFLGTSTYALKWYHPDKADRDLRRRIATLIGRGSPDPRFLWPREEITGRTGTGFGYLMNLVPPGFRELTALFASTPATRLVLDLRARAQVGIEIVDCFLKLHAGGFCYRDINLGAFLLDPSSLGVRVCDNDNIDINGSTSNSVGTLLFMAPELVRGEAVPSADTDLFSLAVLLFYLLMDGHPLLGRAEYEIAYPVAGDWQRLLGFDPCFIFDPDDTRNAAIPGVHDRQIATWNTLPAGLCALFVRTFGQGLKMPRRRALASEWRPMLEVVRDTAVTCGCAIHFATVMGRSGSTAEGDYSCGLCGEGLPPAPRLAIGTTCIVLTPTAKLFASHVGARVKGNDRPVGELATNAAGLRGLRNVGDVDWRAREGDGQPTIVAPGRSVTLKPGVQIDFGRVIGKVLDEAP